MSDRDLPSLLRELHTELESQRPLDDETRALVAAVREDLSRALEASDDDAHASLAERLRSSLSHFEEKNPALVQLTQRVIDQLANVGI